MATTYEKVLMTVVITTKSGGEFTVADTVDNAVGSSVWGMIRTGQDILYAKSETEQQYIAHDCICSAVATRTTKEVEKPEDAFCEPIEKCPDEPTP